MAAEPLVARNRTEAIRKAIDYAVKARNASRRPIIVAPDTQTMLIVEKTAANEGQAFGLKVTTWSAMISDLWNLFGDGRTIIGNDERRVLCFALLRAQNQDKEGIIKASPGFAEMLSRLVQNWKVQLLDSEEEPSQPGAAPDLPAVYGNLLDIISSYDQRLRERNQVERADAACALLKKGVLSGRTLILLENYRESEALQHFFEKADLCPDLQVFRIANGCRESSPCEDGAEIPAELKALLETYPFAGKAEPTEPVKRTGTVEFALPAGPVAEPKLIAELILREVREERGRAASQGRAPLPVYVVSPNPETLFEQIGAELSAAGAKGCVAGNKRFADTSDGAAFLNLLQLCTDPNAKLTMASDFALNPRSNLTSKQANRLDLWIRKNRATTQEMALDALELLCSGSIKKAVKLMREGDTAEAMKVLYSKEQLSASQQRVLDLVRLAQEENLEPSDIKALVGKVLILDNKAYGGDVLIGKLGNISSMPAHSAVSVIITGMTTVGYPLENKARPEDAFLEALEIDAQRDGLTAQRSEFFNVIDCARSKLILERPLKDYDAEAAYSCVALDEIFGCYLLDKSDSEALDKDTGVPKLFRSKDPIEFPPLSPGENETLASAHVIAPAEWTNINETAPACSILVTAADAKAAKADAKDLLGDNYIFSPSQIETYLGCPYEWFVQRRLGVSAPDAGFSPLEQGTFAHRVFKAFYETLKANGMMRVTPENLEECRTLLGEIFDRELAAEKQIANEWSLEEDFENPKRKKENKKESPDGMLLPQSSQEEEQVRFLKEGMLEGLAVQAELYPRFRPEFLEFRFGYDDESPVFYAGVPICGSIDRIDIDAENHAVIWDYKGTVDSKYSTDSVVAFLPDVLTWEKPLGDEEELAEIDDGKPKTLDIPLKVQTLIYAQVARRLLGLEPIAALYLSYKNPKPDQKIIAGAYLQDFGFLGQYLQTAKHSDRIEATSFDELLDIVEERIAVALAYLREGNFPAVPREELDSKGKELKGSRPCKYCPAVTCPEWKEVGRDF